VKSIENVLVDDFTSPCPHVVETETSLDDVVRLMKSEKIRHLPVLEKSKTVGIISDRDLKVLSNIEFAQKFTAGDIMVESPYCVYTGTTLEEVALEMSRRKIGSAVVLEQNGQINGIFTSTDGLNALVEVLRGEILSS
jgi:acetoin utilization protein AcuB